MARVQAPLMSLSASGTLASAITFSSWKGRPYVRTRVVPANPRTGLQTGMRAGITVAPQIWNDHFDAAMRAAWNAGVGAEAISGFNLMCRQGQQNIRNNYGPAGVYPSTGCAGTPAAPVGPAAAQDGVDMDLTWTDEALAHGVLIFHSLTTPFTPGIINLVACVRQTLEAWTHRNPGVGTHYYDIRSYDSDSGVGALAGEFNGTIV